MLLKTVLYLNAISWACFNCVSGRVNRYSSWLDSFRSCQQRRQRIVNASVLKTMSVLWRKRFLLIGIITSVFLVRFILPLVIVWISVPTISASDLFLAFLGQSDVAASAIEQQKPIILMFGGVFLLYLYIHWLFLEKKDPLYIERFIKEKHGVWFFAFAASYL